jgi:uncharacterized 2Fe-2S/4Fe-4S cluster protein (DUF4445 family)
VEGDMLVFVPEESRAGKQVVSKAARDIHIDHNPAVRVYYVEVDPPTFEEPTGDFERICRGLERDYGLKDLTIDIVHIAAAAHGASRWQLESDGQRLERQGSDPYSAG